MVLITDDMKSFIQITRHLYEEPYHLNLVIIASNGLAMGSLEFYLNTSALKDIGEALKKSITSKPPPTYMSLAPSDRKITLPIIFTSKPFLRAKATDPTPSKFV